MLSHYSGTSLNDEPYIVTFNKCNSLQQYGQLIASYVNLLFTVNDKALMCCPEQRQALLQLEVDKFSDFCRIVKIPLYVLAASWNQYFKVLGRSHFGAIDWAMVITSGKCVSGYIINKLFSESDGLVINSTTMELAMVTVVQVELATATDEVRFQELGRTHPSRLLELKIEFPGDLSGQFANLKTNSVVGKVTFSSAFELSRKLNHHVKTEWLVKDFLSMSTEVLGDPTMPLVDMLSKLGVLPNFLETIANLATVGGHVGKWTTKLLSTKHDVDTGIELSWVITEKIE